MVSINYSSREVCCKIVYYGPGLSGKTTNLIYVHEKVPGTSRGDMISLATEADRTLYFDFLPINIGSINGFAAKFQLYTVPGQVYYNATRKLVLRGVDGVVFVADSQPDKMDENIDSLANLEDNLKEYGYDLKSMPFVLQYNKRDLPGVHTFDELQAKLNPTGVPAFEASATLGTGVFDTLKKIIKLVLDKAKTGGSSSSTKVSEEVTSSESSDAESVTTPPPTTGAEPESAPISAKAETSATATATVAPPEQEEAESDPAQYRPYPGGMSQKIQIKDKKISATSFTPAPDEPGADASLERKAVSTAQPEDEESTETMSTPLMAPALKSRRERRKRGFFKKLFGIK